jgi:tRNA(Ile)-lysidine synthase
MRRRVLPALRESFGPGAVAALARASRLLAEEDPILEGLAEAAAGERLAREGDAVLLDAAGLAALPRPLRARVLLRALEEARGGRRGISSRHVEALDRIVAGERGGADLGGGLRAERTGALLRIGPPLRAPDPFRYPLEVPGEVTLPEAGAVLEARFLEGGPDPDEIRTRPRDQAWLDAASLGGELLVRSRRPGDRIRPVGLGGRSRKLQDLLVDRKVPRLERDRLPILVAGGEVAWVAGVTAAEPFRVRAGTTRILHLRLRPARR